MCERLYEHLSFNYDRMAEWVWMNLGMKTVGETLVNSI